VVSALHILGAMKCLVTGSSGHLGEALVRTLSRSGHDVLSLDIKTSVHTSIVGSITDASLVADAMRHIDVVFHAATLHKPHVATHEKREFVDTNVHGTLTLLEAATAARVTAFIFTSTTSTFGDALRPPKDEPAAWITEGVTPLPKNIYGVTKTAAEDLCQIFARDYGLPCIVLRTSRFFPEADDDPAKRNAYPDENLKMNELLFRRADLEDMVSAHLLAAEHGARLGFRRYIVTATTPFRREDLAELRTRASRVVGRYVPGYEGIYRQRRWKMFDDIDRVYINDAIRRDLGWQPKHDFASVLERVGAGGHVASPFAREIEPKGYHDRRFDQGPYPV
jgi:nucleoside-diphosphate-sugar epimerase